MRRFLPRGAVALVLVLGLVVGLAWSQDYARDPESRAVRQGSVWTLSHIGSQVHVSGAMELRDKTCVTCTARVDHYNAVAMQAHVSGGVRMWQVSQCGSTAATAVATNTNRRALMVKNLGTTANVNIWVGYGTTGHVALSTANGWALGQHEGTGAASSWLVLDNYQGPLSCISTVAGMTLGVTEVLR